MNAMISLQQDVDEEKHSHTKRKNLHHFDCSGTSGMLLREPDYSLPRKNANVSNSYSYKSRAVEDDTFAHAGIGYDVNGRHEKDIFIFEDAKEIQLDTLSADIIWEIFSYLCANDLRYEHANDGMLCEEEIERNTNTFRRNKNTLCDSYGQLLVGFGRTSKANQWRCLSFLQEISIVLYTSDLLHVQKMAWLGRGNRQVKVEELILSDVTSENVQYYHCMLQHVLPCDLSHLQYLNTNIDLYMEEPEPISMQEEEFQLELLQAGVSYECIQSSMSMRVTSKREFISHLVHTLIQRGANIQYLVVGVELEELNLYHMLLQYNSKMLRVLDLHILESEGNTADTTVVGQGQSINKDGSNPDSDDTCSTGTFPFHDNLLCSFDNYCLRTIEDMPNLETLYLSSDEILDVNFSFNVNNLSSDSLTRLDLAGSLTNFAFERGRGRGSECTCTCSCPNLEIFNLRTRPIRSSDDLTAIATFLQHCSQHMKELRLCFDSTSTPSTYDSSEEQQQQQQQHCHCYDLSDILMKMPQLKKLFLDEWSSDSHENEVQPPYKCPPRIKVQSNSIEHLGICGDIIVDFDHPYPYPYASTSTSTSASSSSTSTLLSSSSNSGSSLSSSSSLSGIKHLDFYGPLATIHELITTLYTHSYGHEHEHEHEHGYNYGNNRHEHNSILSTLESIDICINCLDDDNDNNNDGMYGAGVGVGVGAHCKLEQLQRMVLNMSSLQRRTIRLVGYACIRSFMRA